MPNTSLQTGDVYALQEKETGKWFTFQIVQTGEEDAVFIDLDYWSEMIPEEKDLSKMSYLRLNHHLWNNEIHPCWAPIKFFPSRAKKVGCLTVRPFEECRTYGNWPDGGQQKWTEKWEDLPKDQIAAFKEARAKRNETLIVAGKEVRKNLYGVFDDTLGATSVIIPHTN